MAMTNHPSYKGDCTPCVQCISRSSLAPLAAQLLGASGVLAAPLLLAHAILSACTSGLPNTVSHGMNVRTTSESLACSILRTIAPCASLSTWLAAAAALTLLQRERHHGFSIISQPALHELGKCYSLEGKEVPVH